jgi:hypothetical protein
MLTHYYSPITICCSAKLLVVYFNIGAHTASDTMETGSFRGVKWLGHGVDHPNTSSAEVKERVELYLYSNSGPLWPVLG